VKTIVLTYIYTDLGDFQNEMATRKYEMDFRFYASHTSILNICVWNKKESYTNLSYIKLYQQTNITWKWDSAWSETTYTYILNPYISTWTSTKQLIVASLPHKKHLFNTNKNSFADMETSNNNNNNNNK